MISIRRVTFVPWLACVFGAACARPPQTEFVAINALPHAATVRGPDGVEIIATARPARPYAEIGQLQTRVGSADAAALQAHLREQGYRHGCDALLITDKDTYAAANANGGSVVIGSLSAVCIMYVVHAAAAESSTNSGSAASSDLGRAP